MLHGRFLSDMDNRHHLPVAVIGEDLGKAWFRNSIRSASGSMSTATSLKSSA